MAAPSTYEELPGDWETSKKVHSMCSLGLRYTKQIRIAQLDFCYQGKHMDMPNYWIDLTAVPVLEQLYVSWNAGIGTWERSWQLYSRDLWHYMGNGQTTYFSANSLALRDHGTVDIMRKMENAVYGDTNTRFTR